MRKKYIFFSFKGQSEDARAPDPSVSIPTQDSPPRPPSTSMPSITGEAPNQ